MFVYVIVKTQSAFAWRMVAYIVCFVRRLVIGVSRLLVYVIVKAQCCFCKGYGWSLESEASVGCT